MRSRSFGTICEYPIRSTDYFMFLFLIFCSNFITNPRVFTRTAETAYHLTCYKMFNYRYVKFSLRVIWDYIYLVKYWLSNKIMKTEKRKIELDSKVMSWEGDLFHAYSYYYCTKISWLFCYYRSSRPEVFYKKGGLRNFTKFTRKHLCQSNRCFPVNCAKFLRTSFFTEHLWWLLLLLERFTDLSVQRYVNTDNIKKMFARSQFIHSFKVVLSLPKKLFYLLQ